MAEITRENYWRQISTRLNSFIKETGLIPVDIYLAGSTLNTLIKNITWEKDESDIDSIILIKNNLSLDVLRNLRARIQKYLRIQKADNIYHFKVFSEHEMQLFSKYDGFRLFEIQNANFSLYQSDTILNYTPHLSKQCFCNSVLVQLVYESLMKDGYLLKNGVWHTEKLKKRVERSFQIFETYSTNTFKSEANLIQFCLDNDELFKKVDDMLAEIAPSRKKFVYWVMYRYFKRLRHEYVNKSSDYMEKMNSILI